MELAQYTWMQIYTTEIEGCCELLSSVLYVAKI